MFSTSKVFTIRMAIPQSYLPTDTHTGHLYSHYANCNDIKVVRLNTVLLKPQNRKFRSPHAIKHGRSKTGFTHLSTSHTTLG